MTRERTKELLPVLEAWARGEVVEWRHTGFKEWRDSTHDAPKSGLNFDDPYLEWRVKPKAREWWVCENCHHMQSTARERCPICTRLILTHVREVLP